MKRKSRKQNRITTRKVLNAYKKIGLKACRNKFGSRTSGECCPLTALILAKYPDISSLVPLVNDNDTVHSEEYIFVRELGLTPKYVNDFIFEIDTKYVNDFIFEIDTNFLPNPLVFGRVDALKIKEKLIEKGLMDG